MDNKALYTHIMHNVSKQLKHILNEELNNFNTEEYQDDNETPISNETLAKISNPSKKEVVQDLLGCLVDLNVKVKLPGAWGGKWCDIIIDDNGNIRLKDNCRVYD